MKVTIESFKTTGKHNVMETYKSSLKPFETNKINAEVSKLFPHQVRYNHTIEVDDDVCWNKWLNIIK